LWLKSTAGVASEAELLELAELEELLGVKGSEVRRAGRPRKYEDKTPI